MIPATSAETTTNGTDLTSAKGIEYAHTYWCEGHTNVQGPKGQGTLGVVKCDRLWENRPIGASYNFCDLYTR